MHWIIDAAITGLIATTVMDVLSLSTAYFGINHPVNHRVIGRLAHGWMRGVFAYRSMQEIRPVSREIFKGFIAHFGIGIAFAIIYSWALLLFQITPRLWLIGLFGLATSLVSLLILYPLVGLRIFAFSSPQGALLRRTSIVNHAHYGIGLILGMQLVNAS